MAMRETKTGSHSITTIESSSFLDETGKSTTINESWTATENQRELSAREIKRERRESFSDFLGVGRYFVIFCLILFFIAPIYRDLNEHYIWNVEENGNTYTYTNPNEDNVKAYVDLGNKMMSGFTETLNTLGNISDVGSDVTDAISKINNWWNKGQDLIKNGLNNVKDWFIGLFD